MGACDSDGPHTGRVGRSRSYRGSRKRIRRITIRGNMSVEFWTLLVLTLILLVGLLPWVLR